jgi:hypothetical protein
MMRNIINLTDFWVFYANWRIIRSLAELRILTRISYFMLVFVPLLAGIWPAVIILINQYDKALNEELRLFEAGNLKLDLLKSDVAQLITQAEQGFRGTGAFQNDIRERLNNSIASLDKAQSHLDDQVARVSQTLSARMLNTPKLPWVWAAAFFAALAAAVGQLLYQLSAPDPVRRYNLEEHINRDIKEYFAHPSDAKLRRARETIEETYLPFLGGLSTIEFIKSGAIIKELGEDDEEERKRKIRNFDFDQVQSILHLIKIADDRMRHFNSRKLIGYHIEAVGAFLEWQKWPEIRTELEGALNEVSKNINADERNRRFALSLIERSSRIDYIRLSRSRWPMIIISAFFYLAAICVVLLLTYHQAEGVINAAGWSSYSDLLRRS